MGTISRPPEFHGDLYWYTVRFPGARPEMVPEPDLEAFVDAAGPEDHLRNGALGGRDEFLRLITFQKLDEPLDNALYAFQSSRTQFHPHQYRPLLKFLDSGHHRLLIADEVGLGKTIEAGLILSELRARRALRSCLVVCPKALCSKWREEMWRRFDEDFTIMDARRLEAELADIETREHVPDFRWIVPLQSLRRGRLLDRLEAVTLAPDLLIFDEAHHLRNPETLSHNVAATLAGSAFGVLLLTATPVQLGDHNLFHLLRLLDPAEFSDEAAFAHRLEANAPVVEAERLLRSSYPPPIDAVRERIDSLSAGRGRAFFQENPLYRRVREALSAPLDRAGVARLQHDLKDLHLLAHVFTRTRKREVFAEPRLREAKVFRPPMLDVEREFYEAVTEFVRNERPTRNGEPHFAAVTAQRQVASCMPAAGRLFAERAAMAISDEEYEEIAYSLDMDDDGARQTVSFPVRVLAAARALGSADSKFDELLKALTTLDTEEPGRPVLLFSYFRATLEYLRNRLRDHGYTSEVIHGGVPSDPANPDRDERARRIRRFRDGEVRVLLSSEVGGEGLDFQFCHVMVNYDLPWNPMLVEQRIGRLDRMGQEAKRIVIVNFSVPGTIEARILDRLYARIGIFQRSIGDLEAILGDEVAHLTRELFTRHLTAQEEEELIERAALAIQTRREALERLEAEADRLVGADQYFRDRLAQALAAGAALDAADVEAYVRLFLRAKFPAVRPRKGDRAGVFRLVGDPSLEAALRTLPPSPPLTRFLHHLRSSDGARVAFDSEVAFSDASVDHLAAHHPLVQLATQHYRLHQEELHPATALRVTSAEAPAGDYLFALHRVTLRAERERQRLEVVFVDLDSGSPLGGDEGGRLLGCTLREGVAWDAPPPQAVQRAGELLDRAAVEQGTRVQGRVATLRERAETLYHVRLATLTATHEVRYARKAALLDRKRAEGSPHHYLRMLEGTLENMIHDFEERKQELARGRSLTASLSLVGCGILRVEVP